MGIPAYLYSIALSAKRAYSLGHQKKLHCKVISVGNITVGGTGKTPATIAIAKEAMIRGFSPVVLTRGYKGSAKGPCFVTKGEGPLLNAEEAGDEPVLMAEKLQGVSIVKGSNRYEAGLFALQNINTSGSTLNAPTLFILDDGFQHWKLYRDKNILLIDCGNPFGGRKLFPLGKLREPLSAIERADIVVLTKCKDHDGALRSQGEAILAEIKKYNANALVFLSGHSIVSSHLQVQPDKKMSPAMMRDRKVFAFCALGNPESFKATVADTGAVITGFRTFRDHHKYSTADIAKIKLEAGKSGAELFVTTEKDMIKIRDLDLPENIIIIGIEFSVDKGFFDAVFAL